MAFGALIARSPCPFLEVRLQAWSAHQRVTRGYLERGESGAVDAFGEGVEFLGVAVGPAGDVAGRVVGGVEPEVCADDVGDGLGDDLRVPAPRGRRGIGSEVEPV